MRKTQAGCALLLCPRVDPNQHGFVFVTRRLLNAVGLLGREPVLTWTPLTAQLYCRRVRRRLPFRLLTFSGSPSPLSLCWLHCICILHAPVVLGSLRRVPLKIYACDGWRYHSSNTTNTRS